MVNELCMRVSPLPLSLSLSLSVSLFLSFSLVYTRMIYVYIQWIFTQPLNATNALRSQSPKINVTASRSDRQIFKFKKKNRKRK